MVLEYNNNHTFIKLQITKQRTHILTNYQPYQIDVIKNKRNELAHDLLELKNNFKERKK